MISSIPELIELAGKVEAARILELENRTLGERIAAKQRKEEALRASINFNMTEIAALRAQLKDVVQQKQLREKQLGSIKSLEDRGLVNQRRVFEEEMAASLIARDTQETIASIARAERTLEDSRRDLDILEIERQERIRMDLAEVDESIARALATIAGSKRLISSLLDVPDAFVRLSLEPSVEFEIVRRNADDIVELLKVDENFSMRPGDILRVNISNGT